jgi:hypothetical protein
MGEAYGEDDKYSLHRVYSENMKLSAVDESFCETLTWVTGQH